MKVIGIIGLGWLGLPLALELEKKGFQVWGTTRNSKDPRFAQLPTSIEVMDWESGDSRELEPYIQQTDSFILTLPPSAFDRRSKEIIAELLTKFPKGSTVLYTSSIGVYLNKHGELTESSPLDVDHPVFLTEKAIQSHPEIQSIILRLGGLIGGNRHPVHYLIKKENDDPHSWVQLIHLKDCIRIICELLISEKKDLVLNVVNPILISRKDYYSKVAQDLQLTSPQFSDNPLNNKSRVVKSNIFAELLPGYSFESLYCY